MHVLLPTHGEIGSDTEDDIDMSDEEEAEKVSIEKGKEAIVPPCEDTS